MGRGRHTVLPLNLMLFLRFVTEHAQQHFTRHQVVLLRGLRAASGLRIVVPVRSVLIDASYILRLHDSQSLLGQCAVVSSLPLVSIPTSSLLSPPTSLRGAAVLLCLGRGGTGTSRRHSRSAEGPGGVARVWPGVIESAWRARWLLRLSWLSTGQGCGSGLSPGRPI